MVIGMITMCSLQITPACNLPLKSLRGGGKIVIVNLQVLNPLFPAKGLALHPHHPHHHHL